MHKFIALFIAVIFIHSCTHSIEEVDALMNQVDTSVDIGKDVNITYSDSGMVQVIIESPTVEKSSSVHDPIERFPDGIKITFLNKKGSPVSWLTADEAIKDDKSKSVIARGNVNFYNADNEKLQSHELIWLERQSKVYTDKFIRITRPMVGDTLYGIGFESSEAFKKVKIRKKFQGKMYLNIPE